MSDGADVGESLRRIAAACLAAAEYAEDPKNRVYGYLALHEGALCLVSHMASPLALAAIDLTEERAGELTLLRDPTEVVIRSTFNGRKEHDFRG